MPKDNQTDVQFQPIQTNGKVAVIYYWLMPSTIDRIVSDRRLLAFAAALAVHVALIHGWRVATSPVPREPDSEPRSMQLFWVKPIVVPLIQDMLPPRPRLPRPQHRSSNVQPAPPAPGLPDAPATPPRGEPNAGELLVQAKAAVGKIAQDLRKERRGVLMAPPDSPELRMRRGLARAAELAPNKWYEVPKMEELVVAGGSGARRYRVTTANGEYCVTYETNHSLDGRDTMKNGIQPKFTSCPKYEQPATKQE